jgi:uncharacterized protein YutE (UPF0331/DUF86 family)
MVISSLRVDRIEKGISLIQEYMSELRNMEALSKADFLSDKRNPAAAESYLRRSLEAAFDIGRHILSKTYGIKDIEYKNIARELGAKGVVDAEYARVLIKMAGYRNRMVHLYHEVGAEELYDILKRHLQDIERFNAEMSRFIEDYRKSGR